MEEPTQRDIREINYKIEDIEKSVGLLLRGRRKEVISELMETCFKNSAEKVRVFLAVNGQLSISEIALKLNIKQPNVSRHIKDLIDHDLISVRNVEHARILYEKTSQVNRLRLEEFLIDTFGDRVRIDVASEQPKEQKESLGNAKSGIEGSDIVTSV